MGKCLPNNNNNNPHINLVSSRDAERSRARAAKVCITRTFRRLERKHGFPIDRF